ncbi:PREDICTED: uncharacterized protein LOC104612272 [Nelumbo nucifera]|uniref:Uncharacterized protein LOC104612272 n=2 Tax=Nelumbo nucifera TaxID=4432 RepID=A0A1U8BDF2_NELNU|nr:PREDICTED: uncharacterized protein LOC104612272 [Nelumbo nucifera]DAD20784.1 TPA_asm: hypothetical protein HUJ06_022247 [Nelumbo nucifera]
MQKKRFEMSSFATKVFFESIGFFQETLSLLSFLDSDPLFSILIALYGLILLYFPRIFLDLVFSPVLISSGILISTLLRLGAIQSTEERNGIPTVEKESSTSTGPEEIDSTAEDDKWVSCNTNTEPKIKFDFVPNPFFFTSFLETNLKAPLEVIYEDCEGEDEESNEKEETRQVRINRLLSLYHSESDTDSSSDGEFPEIAGWDSPQNMCFTWGEDDKEGLIEIPLDGKRSPIFHVEEDNLIEIDISLIGAPKRNTDFLSGQCQFQLMQVN